MPLFNCHILLDKGASNNSNLYLLVLGIQMALQFFEGTESSGSLPFLDEYLESNPKAYGKTFQVEEIKKVKSGKGYLLQTDSFSAFIWNNEKLTKQLIEALKVYAETGEGYVLVIMPDKSVKSKFRLAADTERVANWFQRGNDFSVHSLVSDSPIEGNPFLPPAPHTPTGTSLATSRQKSQTSPTSLARKSDS